MVSYVFNLFLQLITFLVGLLPTSSGLPDGVTTAVSRMIGFLHTFDFIFPVDTMLTILRWIIVFELGVIAYRFTLWIIHLIRGN